MTVEWTGNLGEGTKTYTGYSRDHLVSGEGKTPIAGSSAPAFRGDNSRYNPEEFLVSSLSACHMLWYLHLCASAGIVVEKYTDHSTGVMTEEKSGDGKFVSVHLKPEVVVTREADLEPAMKLHEEAHKKCFIANSVNFPVTLEPKIQHAL